MKYIIFDIEATCDEIDDFPMETIEIGAVKLDSNGNYLGEFSELIKPHHSHITDYCTNLTGINDRILEFAPPFPLVLEMFKEFIGKDEHILYSWGAYDKKQLLRDCETHGVDSSFLNYHRNMKEFYTEVTGVRAKGLKKAMNYTGVVFEGSRHRAYPDALATSRVFKRILEIQKKDL